MAAVGLSPTRLTDPANIKPPTHDHQKKNHRQATVLPPEHNDDGQTRSLRLDFYG